MTKISGSIVIYQAKPRSTKIEVKLEKDTVWLDQKQISQLFQIDRSVVTKHLEKIFSSGELIEKSNVQKMHIAFSDKPVKYYNLDVVISVGYRVNSKRATQFRIWATKVLKNYLIRGYAINRNRLLLQQNKFMELKQAVEFLQRKAYLPEIKLPAGEILSIIGHYTQSLTLLYQYDKGKVPTYRTRKPRFNLTYENACALINDAKRKLMEKKEATDYFGKEVSHKFSGVIGAVYQTFDKKDLYESIEEKAAHLLYFVIKDHPFVDGNKRIGSLLFLYFLSKNAYLYRKNGESRIPDTTMVALALLIAISEPKEKDIMIDIITNLLKG